MITTEDEARAFVAARCDADGFALLERFADLLEDENGRQNLVARESVSTVWMRHIADSAQLLDHVPRETAPWLDMGTGAGFPGVVIAAMRPHTPVILVESRRKRIEWLERVTTELKLPNVQVRGVRLELMDSLAAGVISARAFAPLDKLFMLARRFSTSDTWWLLPKGRSAAQEVERLPESVRPMFHVEQSATDEDSGIVVGRIAKGQDR